MTSTHSARLKDILVSFTELDLRIVCRDGKETFTSSLLFAISSGYMRSILKEVFEHRSRLDEEIVTIFLPDFSVTSIDGVVKVKSQLTQLLIGNNQVWLMCPPVCSSA